jgi:hypothetical protein
MGEMLKDMQRCGVIKESGSPLSSTVILVQKKNGDLHSWEETLWTYWLEPDGSPLST